MRGASTAPLKNFMWLRTPEPLQHAHGEDHLTMCNGKFVGQVEVSGNARLVCALRVTRNVHRVVQADYRFDEKPQSQDGLACGAAAERANFRGCRSGFLRSSPATSSELRLLARTALCII